MRGFNSIDNLSKAECLRQLQNEADEDIRVELQNRIENIDKAERRKETEALNKCCSISDYERFLIQYPNSTYRSQASMNIDDLTFASLCKSKSGCETYLGQYPGGRHKSEAEEKIAKVRRRRLITLIIFIIIIIIFIAGYHPAGSIVFSQNIKAGSDDLKINKTGVCLVVTSSRFLMTPVLAALPQSDHKTVSFSKEGGTKEVSVSSNANSDNLEIISKDGWVNAHQSSDGKIKISVSSNSGAKRSASIVIRAWSTLFGKRISSTDGTIYIEQEAGGATYLNLSASELSFDDNGGERTITVDTDYSWSIGTSTASWGHLVKSGNELALRVDPNTSTDTRRGWFTIKAGQKEERVNITQEGCVLLSVSSDELNFGSSGGSQTISVYASKSWEIGTDTYSWGHLSKNGNQLTVRIDQNTNTSSRTDYFSIKAGQKQKRVNISQDGSTNLSVSSENLSFSPYGGSQTITVSSSRAWEIGTNTNSWGHLSKNGNQLTVRIDQNTSPSSRTDWFSIKAGDKEKRINITQSGKSASYLNPSQTTISVSSAGGTRTISVSSDGSWEIGVGTNSWIDLSKNGNTLTLDIERNNSSEPRDDYFTIKSGTIEKRITINQSGDNTPDVDINRVWVEHNITRTGYNNVFNPLFGWQQIPYTYLAMLIHVDFNVNNMKGKTIWVCAFFFDEDGDKMTTSNNQFRSPDGQVTVQGTGNPTYTNSKWSDYPLEIPYSVMRRGRNKFYIQIQDSNGHTLSTSDYEYFSVN